jgi:hypothetical protein
MVKAAYRIAIVASVMILVGAASVASAQTCTGYGSFRDHREQIGLGAAVALGAHALALTATGGGDRLFGGASLTAEGYDNLEGRVYSVGGGVGSDIPVGASQRVYVCPIAAASWTTGELEGVDLSGLNFSSGGQLGIIAGRTATVDIIPTVGGRVVHARSKAEWLFFEETASQTYGLAQAGVGFVFNRQYALVPMVGIPIGVDDAEISVGINFGINF